MRVENTTDFTRAGHRTVLSAPSNRPREEDDYTKGINESIARGDTSLLDYLPDGLEFWWDCLH